jgi:hypothetical protein
VPASTPRAGDHGWKPDEADVERAGSVDPHLALRILSIVPFLFVGVVGVIAAASWLMVVVLGVGTYGGAVWARAQGLPAGEALAQVGLVLLTGAGCAAVVVGSMYGAMIGFRERQPRWFWPLTLGVWSVVLIAWVVGRYLARPLMIDLGFGGAEWYFALAVVVFALIVTGLRMRAARGGQEQRDG